MKKKTKVIIAIFFFLLIFLIFNAIRIFKENNLAIYTVQDRNMEDTLKYNSMTIAQRGNTPKRYQIVAFKVGDEILTKRVIGMPEDKIEIYYRDIYYNDIKSFDNFITGKMEKIEDKNRYSLSENMYFVIEDNRDLFDIENLKNKPEEYFITRDMIEYIIDSNIQMEDKALESW